MPNITQFEDVTFIVGGANPQQKTVQVAFSVNPTTGIGSATASLTYTGTNSGIDTVTANLGPQNLTSNAATVAWQACPSLISASNVISVGVIHNGQNHGFNITSPVAFTYTLTVASLYYNVNPATFNIPGLVTNFDEAQPGVFVNVTAQGTYAGTTTPLQNSTATIKDGGNTVFKMVMTGSFVVRQAGNYTINVFVDDSYILSIGGGASRIAGTGQIYNPYGQTVGPYTGFPVLMAANDSASSNISQSPSPLVGVINFPTAGIYPFEIDYNNYEGPGGEFDLGFNGNSVIIPVTLLTPPAQPAAGNQNLVLTPTGGATNLKVQGGQVTLNLALNNIQFTTQPYIPLLEGSLGQVYIYNDPLNPTFSFQSYYGNTPDGPSAAVDDFTLVGDNTAWQGQVSLQWNSTLNKFQLYYNGSQSLAPNQLFAPNVQATTLTVTQEDIAWFNPTGPEYDTFQATSAGGGKFASIPVYYLLNPNYPAGAAVQVSPTTVVTGTPPPAQPLTPIRRVSWSSGGNISNGAAGAVLTVYGEGRGLSFPASIKVGAQVILSGFVGGFPSNSNPGQGGSSQVSTATSLAHNLNGTYTIQAVGSEIVGGSEVCPTFTLIAPASTYARSFDFGSSGVVNSGWYFQPVVPAGSATSTFTVTLARPLPPLQNNTTMAVAFSGTQPSNVTVTPNLATINSIAGWIVSYSVTATFSPQAVASTTTMTFTFATPTITFLGTLGTAIDQFTTLTNYTYAGAHPSATITLQATGSATNAPYNVSLTETNGGTPVSSAHIGASTVITATWVSYNNNFANTVFYITPNGGSKVALGTVNAGSATITSIGGGKYQAVFTLTANTAAYYSTNTYQFSYTGTCTDNSTVSYSDTNFYSSNNPAPAGGGGGGSTSCFSGNVGIKTSAGFVRFDECPGIIQIENETGTHLADLITHDAETRAVIDMGSDQLVTLDHVIKAGGIWDSANVHLPSALYVRKEYEGKVYNLHIRSDKPEDQHYILDNGIVAHNAKVLVA